MVTRRSQQYQLGRTAACSMLEVQQQKGSAAARVRYAIATEHEYLPNCVYRHAFRHRLRRRHETDAALQTVTNKDGQIERQADGQKDGPIGPTRVSRAERQLITVSSQFNTAPSEER